MCFPTAPTRTKMITLALLLALAPTPNAHQHTEPAAGTLFTMPERVPRRDGSFVTAERGWMFVPLVRAQADSRVISVEFIRFPAEEGAPEGVPPIFDLPGGPGFSGVGERLTQPGYYESIQRHTRLADYVLVGQRGIGTSKPNTVCLAKVEAGRDATRAEQDAALIAANRACREYWEGQGYDMRGFNVLEAAGDVNDIRKALGYDKIQLWAVSFGSHWSMATMRTYPEIIERAVLSGLEGPDHTYDMPSWVLNALERIAESAAESGALQGMIPEGGLIEAFKAVIARAEKEPLEIKASDPQSGQERTLRFSADDVRSVALGYTSRASSRFGIRTWPADVLKLYHADYADAAASALQRSGPEGLPTASFFNLDCGSGISKERGAVLRADPAASVVGARGHWYDTACSAWDSDLGEAFRENFETEIPTLLVQGNWDTSTPLENTLELAPYFIESKLVVVYGGSHGALNEALGASQEFRDSVAQFQATGDMEAVPEYVELPPVDWAVPALR